MADRRKNKNQLSPLRTSNSGIINSSSTHVSSASTTSSVNSSRSNQSSSASAAFYPRLIFSQIVALQSWHYFVLSIFFQSNHYIFGTTITVDRLFTAKYLKIWSAQGWADNGVVLISSLLGAGLLAILVEKSKKCLDFSVTLFLLHLIFCSVYDGFPATWDWWIVNILGLIIMVVFGEFLCSRMELREIPLLAY